jgi:hypothetical protein
MMTTNIGIRARLNLPYEQAVQKTTDALKAEGLSVLDYCCPAMSPCMKNETGQ